MTDKMEVKQEDIKASCSFLELWEPGPERTQDKLANDASLKRTQSKYDGAVEVAMEIERAIRSLGEQE